MSNDLSTRALALVERISRAASAPEGWADFVADLAAELGDAAIGMTLDLPNSPGPTHNYSVNIEIGQTGAFSEFVSAGLPWSLESVSTQAFRSLGDLLPDSELVSTSFYREYMVPLDLAPESPIAHIFAQRGPRPLAGIGIFRRNGCRPFSGGDLKLLDLLVPHLAQAYLVHERLLGHRQRSDAISEAIDRFPMGMLLIDEKARVVESNRAAKRLIDRGDGLGAARWQALFVRYREQSRAAEVLEASGRA